MSDDWMRPITKPLPGPVPTEDAVLTALERARIAAVAEPTTLPTGGRPQGEAMGARSVVAAPPQTEKQFLQAVRDLARILGWRCYHTFNAYRSPEGFPDLVLLRSPRLIFAELKSAIGKTSPRQDEWLAELQLMSDAVARLARCAEDVAAERERIATRLPSVDVFVWYPADFDEIARVLAR